MSTRLRRVVLLTHELTEELGGPAVAGAGFARAIAALGYETHVIAVDRSDQRWLMDEASARTDGVGLQRVARRAMPLVAASMVQAARPLVRDAAAHTMLWVNSIWGPHSLCARALALQAGTRYVVAPNGSLGRAALRVKALKKRLYYNAIEAPILRRAQAIHCMSQSELDELPAELKARAVVVPFGVDLAFPTRPPRDGSMVRLGVLARVHPIKRHEATLGVVRALRDRGMQVEMEFAGHEGDGAFAAQLRAAVHAQGLDANVRFLGHVAAHEVPDRVARWDVALLLSAQENFGHAVVTAAAAGVPTVVSAGVGLGPELETAGAGAVADDAHAADAVLALLKQPQNELQERCRAFASRYGWDRCARMLCEVFERSLAST